MPAPKDHIKRKEGQEKLRKIAIAKNFGKLMKGRKDTPFLLGAKRYTASIKETGNKVKLNCKFCNKEFSVFPYQISIRKSTKLKTKRQENKNEILKD